MRFDNLDPQAERDPLLDPCISFESVPPADITDEHVVITAFGRNAMALEPLSFSTEEETPPPPIIVTTPAWSISGPVNRLAVMLALQTSQISARWRFTNVMRWVLVSPAPFYCFCSRRSSTHSRTLIVSNSDKPDALNAKQTATKLHDCVSP